MADHDLWNWAHSGNISGLKECLDRGENTEAKWFGVSSGERLYQFSGERRAG